MPSEAARREGRRFLAAAAFLTRLPVPSVPFEPDWLPRGSRYFSLVGAGIGALAALPLLAASRLWPEPIPALLALAGGVALTGALHEDGLADAADGLGGRTPETRLAIMKDSGTGAYGVLALLIALAVKASALSALPLPMAAGALVGAASGGRAAAVVVLRLGRYAGDPARAKAAHAPERPRRAEVAAALGIALLPLALLPLGAALAALALGTAAAAWAAARLCRPLGGYTGDILGATAMVFETAFLLGAAASWRPL